MPGARRRALDKRYDGSRLLGGMVRGETDHYPSICDAVCNGVVSTTAETGAPTGFGLLTVDRMEQAVARSRDDKHNKGAEAAHALIGQIALARRWRA